MPRQFADRMSCVHRSFVREILKVTEDPEIISFAGGLPNPKCFPVREVAKAAQKVLSECGEAALQYSTTEGFLPLREYIAKRYSKKGIRVEPDEILITNGSQQGLDLIGKVFLNKGDEVVVERPTYLAALQSFSLFEPVFRSVPLLDDGIDAEALAGTLGEGKAKLLYSVPNFQNPTGITYSRKRREEVAEIMSEHHTIFLEDDPYGELRFAGEDVPSMKNSLGDNAVLLGSFSKIVSPGIRLGWISAREDIMEKIIIAKQAADLHSNYLSQRIVHQHLMDNDIDGHIAMIRAVYKRQRDLMVKLMEESFPSEVHFTRPEGGMFLWVTLPEGISSLKLFDRAIKEKVAFVPGQAFFSDGSGSNTMRLNFSNCDEGKITRGIERLANVIRAEVA
jgi:2-aminoadipate transaminase